MRTADPLPHNDSYVMEARARRRRGVVGVIVAWAPSAGHGATYTVAHESDQTRALYDPDELTEIVSGVRLDFVGTHLELIERKDIRSGWRYAHWRTGTVYLVLGLGRNSEDPTIIEVEYAPVDNYDAVWHRRLYGGGCGFLDVLPNGVHRFARVDEG